MRPSWRKPSFSYERIALGFEAYAVNHTRLRPMALKANLSRTRCASVPNPAPM